MSVRIAVKEVNKPLEIIEADAKYRSDVLEKYIVKSFGGFDYLKLDELLWIGVNDDGHALNLPCNFFVLTPFNPYFPIQPLLGTAVFFRTLPYEPFVDNWDIQLGSLTDSDIESINNILRRAYQEESIKLFNKAPYGKGNYDLNLDIFE